jgi:hypothetical protein
MSFVDKVAEELSQDVIDHIHRWMKLSYAEDIKFHYFRMRLLEGLNSENKIGKKLISLCEKITTKTTFDIIQIVSDKLMGDSVAKYIFAKIIIALNTHYLKIIDAEEDKIKAENVMIGNKLLKLKNKISQH